MNKTMSKRELTLSFGTATAILWTVCSLFVLILPSLSFTIFKWWMHGINIGDASSFNLTWGNFILGGITLTLSMMAVGYILGLSFEIINKSKGLKR